jgi:hypothetical protein
MQCTPPVPQSKQAPHLAPGGDQNSPFQTGRAARGWRRGGDEGAPACSGGGEGDPRTAQGLTAAEPTAEIGRRCPQSQAQLAVHPGGRAKRIAVVKKRGEAPAAGALL